MTKNKIFFVNQLMRLRGSDSNELREQLLEYKILDLMIDIRKERTIKGKEPGPDPVPEPVPEQVVEAKPEPVPVPEVEDEDDEEENMSFLYRAGARF